MGGTFTNAFLTVSLLSCFNAHVNDMVAVIDNDSSHSKQVTLVSREPKLIEYTLEIVLL